MQIVEEFSHNCAQKILNEKRMRERIDLLFAEVTASFARGSASALKDGLNNSLSRDGWVISPRVHQEFNLTINAISNQVGLTIQTGNISRAFYDLMKFQAMFLRERLDVAVLALPSKNSANSLGSNIANFERVSTEMRLFDKIITVPCLLISLES